MLSGDGSFPRLTVDIHLCNVHVCGPSDDVPVSDAILCS